MCGIVGFSSTGGNADQQRATVLRMVQTLRHRGPDAEGVWRADDGRIVLGHARLSIQDLSSQGAQPMRSSSGRYVICYNGEVYNFPSLAQELSGHGHHFNGHSDTEVILAAIEQWGLVDAVSRFIGMFAFALWDHAEQMLHLVRDRVGIKPLYYEQRDGQVVFASELKAIRAFHREPATIDRESLALFVRHSYIPAPRTIYAGVRKLQPGTILSIKTDAGGKQKTSTTTYWSIEAIVSGAGPEFGGTYAEAIDELQSLLADAVAQRMIADVPLGAFLSGGIDSSLGVALMQERRTRPVKTFTIGFTEGTHNEAVWAKKVAAHLQTEHRELYVSPDEVRTVIPELAAIYDEPFADSSQIPTILISRLARQDVTVSLSGDGGDELFAGYTRYDAAAATWRSIGWMPYPARIVLSAVLGGASGLFTTIADPIFGRIYDRFGVTGNRGNELARAAAVLRKRGREDLYRYMMSHWKNAADLVQGIATEPATLLSDPPVWLTDRSFRDYMMLVDASTYLPDDILVKVDRASMSCGLEARVPILDHRVVEFALRLPTAYKRNGGRPKAPLKDILARHLPAELVNRPKMGFAMPINDWLRGPLREWSGDLLARERIVRDGYLHAAPIIEKWEQHQSGKHNWAGYLWDVLMFQSWLDGQA